MKRSWKERLLPVVERLQPVAKVAERVATVAVHMKNPTVLGVAGMAASGISALSDQLGSAKVPWATIPTMLSRGHVVDAVEQAGARIRVIRMSGGEYVDGAIGLTRFQVHSDGSVSVAAGGEFREWLRQALDRSLQAALFVSAKDGGGVGPVSYEASPLALTKHNSEQAAAVLASTLPLVGDGRCIMLDGKPGVGKTTMAQIIARDSGLGRVVLLDRSVLGEKTGGYGMSPSAMREALGLLSPGVVIVDDIDKLRMDNGSVEALRASSKLVVMTANNGAHDQVLDGALTRAGRVDEVFTIQPVTALRSAPFDKLSDDEWDEVSQWPHAYMDEVRRRLIGRPNDLRLDDLRSRLTKRTRSGDSLL